MASISDRIKQAMALKNMKQVDIIEKTGINKGALSSYISGKYEPKQTNIYLIAKALDVNESWLMGNDVPIERIPDDQRGKTITDQTKLTPKDERDISKDLNNIMQKLTEGENGPATYDGQSLSPESAELFKDQLDIMLRNLKIINKEKYNPNKNKK